MIQVWMFIFSLMMFTAQASDTTGIKFTPEFEQYLKRPKLKSASKGAKSINPVASPTDEFTQKIKTTILGAASTAGDFNSPFPNDGEESLLYEQIRANLEASHQEIGNRQVTDLDVINRQFNLGVDNFSGFSWQKPFGVVHVYANRKIAANLFDENYIVEDSFTLEIEATTFLQKTNEAGITNFSDAEIGAYAGITFKRVYSYVSYARTYAEGLRVDFSRLFLPFLKLNMAGISRMGDKEVIKRYDNWTAGVGGMISTPPYYGFSFSAGVLAQFAYENLLVIQNNNDKDEGSDKITLLTKGTQSASVQVNLALQANFMNILKLTILGSDLVYEFSKSKEFSLGFSDEQWTHANQEQGLKNELNSIIHGYGKVQSLEPYVINLQEQSTEALGKRGTLLIWGKLAKNKTERVLQIKDEMVRTFYKSYSQNMRVVQNVFSRLFSAAVYTIFKFPMGTKNAALYNRQITLEYEATHPQASDTGIARIDSTEQFSFSINQSYEASRTDRWIDKKFKNDVIWFVDSFTTLPKDYKSIIRSEQLKGPLLVESTLRIEKAGFDYFLALPDNSVIGQAAKICDSKRVNEWMTPEKRQQFLSRLQIGSEACTKRIVEKFIEFKTDYRLNTLKPAIAKFKSFLTKYYKQSGNLIDLTLLFGAENTFINGQLTATTSMGTQFVTPFSAGQFRGLGVIDNYKRSNGSRLPASIVSE